MNLFFSSINYLRETVYHLKIYSTYIGYLEDFQEQKLNFLTSVTNFLEIQTHPDKVSVNCRDYTGQSALDIAVGFRDEALVEDLLSLDDINIPHLYGAILRAVQEGNLNILETLLDVYERKFEGEPDKEKWNMPGFGMTPLMVAASEGNIKITKFLLDKGHLVEKPHHPTCSCPNLDCVTRNDEGESLFQSLRRINAYKALANPVYIMLSSEDPFLTAFTLSRELSSLAYKFPEHKNEYVALSDQCQQFSASLLDQCQDSNEVKTILVQRKGFPDPRPRQFSRLQLAVREKQKKFVAHPSCQQVLRAAWVSGLPKWSTWSFNRCLIHCIAHAVCMPLVAISYIVFPTSYVLNPVRVPLNRFIYSVSSYIIFLGLLVATTYDNESREVQSVLQIILEVLIGAWVVGHFWEVVLDMYLLGIATFLRSWWLVYDLIMFTGFLISEIIFLVIMVGDIWDFRTNPKSRFTWPWYHPFLIAEGIFALFTIMAFCRTLHWYQVLSKLGPLGTSLRYMLGDVLRFLLVVAVFLCAFALGINLIYKNYKTSHKILEDGTVIHQPSEFVKLQSTFKTLFWAGLGMASPDVAAIVVPLHNPHRYTELIGYSMWALYHLVTVVVLLNMLIAMMADSYTRVQRNADLEWKFARSSVLLAFFDKQSALPPPFNLLPSPYGMIILFKSIKHFMKNKGKDFSIKSNCCHWQSEDHKDRQKQYEEAYQDLIRQLIQRYIYQMEGKQRKERIQAVSTAVIHRLKSQIVSEMRKDSIIKLT